MTRDQFLTEKMGECWHEWGWEEGEAFPVCTKCHCRRYHVRDWTNITEWQKWDWFGKLWEWASQQEWWPDFASWPNGTGLSTTKDFTDKWCLIIDLIHPNRFADAVSKYLGWEEENG